MTNIHGLKLKARAARERARKYGGDKRIEDAMRTKIMHYNEEMKEMRLHKRKRKQ